MGTRGTCPLPSHGGEQTSARPTQLGAGVQGRAGLERPPPQHPAFRAQVGSGGGSGPDVGNAWRAVSLDGRGDVARPRNSESEPAGGRGRVRPAQVSPSGGPGTVPLAAGLVAGFSRGTSVAERMTSGLATASGPRTKRESTGLGHSPHPLCAQHAYARAGRRTHTCAHTRAHAHAHAHTPPNSGSHCGTELELPTRQHRLLLPEMGSEQTLI